MAEKWQELDGLIAALESANYKEGSHQNGYQGWVGSGGSERDWTEIDEHFRAESGKAAHAIQDFLKANRGVRLKPPLLARGKLRTPWHKFKTYL